MTRRPAMIFAAGYGTRMRPLTLNLPKPLIPVAGHPLIDRAIATAREAGVERIVVNLHYMGDRIRSHLADEAGILFSDETERILDTGGGLKAARRLLEADEAFTLNPDAVWTGDNPLSRLARAWPDMAADCLLLLSPVGTALGYAGTGDFDLGPDGRVRRGNSFVYTGAQIIRLATLDAVPDHAFSLNLVWDRLARLGRLFGIVHEGSWCDVGRPENIRLAERMLGHD